MNYNLDEVIDTLQESATEALKDGGTSEWGHRTLQIVEWLKEYRELWLKECRVLKPKTGKGRLIDADKLKERARNDITGYDYEDLIDTAPTVFELPDNPTNGDMISSIFPIVDIQPFFTNEPILIIDIEIGENIASAIRCTEDWWNAPYERR